MSNSCCLIGFGRIEVFLELSSLTFGLHAVRIRVRAMVLVIQLRDPVYVTHSGCQICSGFGASVRRIAVIFFFRADNSIINIVLFIGWSIVYVVIGIFVVFLCTSFCCWGFTRSCKSAKKPPLRQRIKPQKYSPLGTQDDEAPSCKSY